MRSNPFVLWILRSLFLLTAVGVGAYAANRLHALDRVYGFILASAAIGFVLVVIEFLSSKTSLQTISAIFFGLLFGFVGAQLCVVFLNFGGEEIPKDVIPVLRLALTVVFCYLAVAILLRSGDRWRFLVPYIEFRRQRVESDRPVILDTSVLIDGRIEGIAQQNLFDNPLLIPPCVVKELRTLGDSRERTKRQRGRRGFEVLGRLQKLGRAELSRGEEDVAAVDSHLLTLARERDAKLMTLDRGLSRAAEIEGITVIDLSALERVFRPRLLPGERLELELQREGEEAGQAVGYLPDGTMVVVSQAKEQIGSTVEIVVTKSLQTAGGRLAFAKLAEAS